MRKIARLGLIIAVICAAFAIYYPHSPAAIQRRNMAIEERYVATIRPIVQSDLRFNDVGIGVTTADLGRVIVFGIVASDRDLADLKHIISSHPPPVKPAWWRVQVATLPASKPVDAN